VTILGCMSLPTAEALGNYPGCRVVQAVVRIDMLLLNSQPIGFDANIHSHGQPQLQVKPRYLDRPE
jgi:hypothetical protein